MWITLWNWLEINEEKEGEGVDTLWMNQKDYSLAVNLLKKGEVIAFPTETVYGLGADATNEEAVNKIFEAKGRPSDNPLIVHVASIDQAKKYTHEWPIEAEKLAQEFWPGPLTIVLKKKGPLAKTVTAGLNTVGIRMPNHPIAKQLIEESGLPLAAPSANSSGKPSPTSAIHVKQDLQEKIAGIVDGGETGVGLESTVLDLTNPSTPLILRPGGVSKEQLETIIGSVEMDAHLLEEKETPKSPGMKYRHYSPNEPVWIVEREWERAIKRMKEKGEKVGLLASEEVIQRFKDNEVITFSLGEKTNASLASQLLYKGLRAFEQTEASVILAEAYPKKGIGEAYMNRLEKAAGNKRIDM